MISSAPATRWDEIREELHKAHLICEGGKNGNNIAGGNIEIIYLSKSTECVKKFHCK